MGNTLIIIELSKAIKVFYDNAKTINEYKDAIDRVEKRKEPFPPPKEAQKILNTNAHIQSKLKPISRYGFPDPDVPIISADELANPATRHQAIQKFKEQYKIRIEYQASVNKFIVEIGKLAKEADIKAQVARDMSKFWSQLMKAPLPDIGTLNKTTYFSYHLLFQKLAGSLQNVARDAISAKQRLEKDIKEYRIDTRILEANLETYGVL